MERHPIIRTLTIRKRFQLWPVVVLLALTLLCFHRLAFSGLILGRGDTYAYFYPYWAVRNAALMQGRLPLWSPDVFMGVPLLANPQLGTFYPLNWPLVPLSPPDGIRLSVLAHIFLALLGSYSLARRWHIGPIAALASAAVFGLGGYLGAHVEQINQLQGLAWLPWLFLLYDRALDQPRRFVLPLAIGLALQFLTGHTQTVFITGVGLGTYGLAVSLTRPSGERIQSVLRALGCLALAGILALPLIAPQLIPTMELTSVSNRSGGLNPNEATAFSLNPLILGRGLLPSYDGIIFGEYVAYGGVIGLGLAGIGLLVPRRSTYARARWLWGALTVLGLLLALGEFNPLYWQLAHLPGFNFFRVPARWLALFALGMSLLAGVGLQALLDAPHTIRWPKITGIAGVILSLAAGSLLAAQSPEDVIGSAVPTAATWIGWGLALAALIATMMLLRAATKQPKPRWSRLARGLPLLALLAELLAASGVLPYNTLVLPEAYSAQRFTISQMRAYDADQTPPGRLLSISELLFDPGDRTTLEARYAQYGLSDLSVRIQHIATKLKEIVAPNLPLVWGIPSIDGFDGGLLPTRHYTAFTRLMLPPDALATIDGRLREILARESCRGACLPDSRWLNLTNTRYLLTDKVFDVWREGVAYDTTFTIRLDPGEPLDLPNPDQFEANAVDLLFTGETLPIVQLGGEILHPPNETALLDDLRWGRWQAAEASAAALTIEASGPVTIR
ncbi:MAG: YfhO family protein, partial [Anaerolineae bacterium]|nr:YfhO family protein [Anaerolineae bacterium]